jgi:hypothetical protein
VLEALATPRGIVEWVEDVMERMVGMTVLVDWGQERPEWLCHTVCARWGHRGFDKLD